MTPSAPMAGDETKFLLATSAFASPAMPYGRRISEPRSRDTPQGRFEQGDFWIRLGLNLQIAEQFVNQALIAGRIGNQVRDLVRLGFGGFLTRRVQQPLNISDL